jgi:hypothetical protein
MNKCALRTKGLDCSGSSKTLNFESNVPGELVPGNLIDSPKDTLLCILEDCNNSQPLIMGFDFEVKDIATPMASLSKLDNFGNVSIQLSSSIIYLFAPSSSHRILLFNF